MGHAWLIITRDVPDLAAWAFPGKTFLLNGIQFIVSCRALLLMPLWLALGLVDVGISPCSKGTMPSWQMDSCAGMLWNQQVIECRSDGLERDFRNSELRLSPRRLRDIVKAALGDEFPENGMKQTNVLWKALQKNLASKKSSTHPWLFLS